ncbi:hypothetical protein DFP72DRAFT_845313 [Ephemerocybe angulata]|uniref:Uncharacterized protein n=1 Tax=Ephemerocybe angulata TaxID=980116 RepID=A0A8H6I5Q4_9AGAR|nr:hypothetical protein DFP72DRAFT_845313 [Tulosesus angulatus]
MSSAPEPVLHPLDLPGRHPLLPKVYTVDFHPLIQKDEKVGTIYVVVGSSDAEKAHELLSHASQSRAFLSTAEISRAGIPNLTLETGFLIGDSDEHPVVFWRGNDKSALAANDVRKFTCTTKDDIKDDLKLMKSLKKSQGDLLGAKEEIGVGKAKLNPETGKWESGILYERHAQATNLRNGERCYPLSTSHQVPRNLDGPAAGRKFRGSLDLHGRTTRELLWIGAHGGMLGMNRSLPDVVEKLRIRSELFNMPRVGCSENVCFPAFQLNVADAETETRDDAYDVDDLRIQLGRAGKPHVDTGDSVGGYTNMFNLTPTHPDVEAEYFFIFDLGIAILMHEFTGLIFSGLHYHCGHQSYYKDGPRTVPWPYVRLTLIGYPATSLLHGTSASALAIQGNGTTIKVSPEAKNLSPLNPWVRPAGAQATYASDGGTIMERRDHMRHVVGSLLQLNLEVLQQYDVSELPRLDRKTFFSAFSHVPNDTREGVEPSSLTFGWEGDNTKLGTMYEREWLDNASIEDLRRKRNSDDLSDAPFGNALLKGIDDDWDVHCQKLAKSIPLCILAEKREADNGESVIGGRPDSRKRIHWQLNPRDKKEDEAEEKDELPVKKGKRKAKEVEVDSASDENQHGSKRRKTASNDGSLEDDCDPQTPATYRVVNMEASRRVCPLPRRSNKMHVLAPPIPAYPNADESDDGDRTDNGAKSVYQGLLHFFDAEHVTNFLEELKDFQNTSSSERLSLEEVLTSIPTLCTDLNLAHAWTLLEESIRTHDKSLVRLYRQRSDIMLSNMMLWEWLEHSIEQGYQAFQTKTPHWLADAFSTAERIITSPNLPQQLDARTFVPNYSEKESCAVYAYPGVPHNVYDLPNRQTLKRKVEIMMKQWFSFDKRPRGQMQAALVRCLIDKVGVACLWMPAVWDAHFSMGDSGRWAGRFFACDDTVDSILHWANQHLKRHPICGSVGPESLAISAVAEVITCFGPVFSPAVYNSYQPAPEPLFLPSGTPEPLEGSSTSSTPHPSTSSIPYTTTTILNQEEMAIFLNQIHTLLPIARNPDLLLHKIPNASTLADKKNNFLADVQADSDRRLPFRDLAISRRRSLAPGGPYSAEHLRTHAGFFSALVYRRITHNSQYLKTTAHPQLLFPTLDAWNTLEAAHDEKHLCNRNAYGAQTLKQRQCKNALTKEGRGFPSSWYG